MKRKFILLAAFVIMAMPLANFSFAASSLPVEASSPSPEPTPESVKAALAEFKSLSKKERKTRIKEAKKELKKYKKERKAGQEPSTNTLLLVILCILLPPLAVYLHQGEINNKFWISLLLTLLFWIPGVIYSLIVVLGAD